ncbi:protein pitchfork-like [Stylophora pistillata]|uniref:protein pitchfork-like n=1 Tax=Stylophora pistillata TaxID=50429 RepID=UPI000C03CA83|nr:protein pitchfork-like [Stylophora pistillata]
MASNDARRAVAFGTTLDRELLPLKIPANRFGNELALRGAPNRGPGCYYNAEGTGFIYELERRPVCRRGYSVGARTAPRFPKPAHLDVPGPSTYQEIISKPVHFDEAFKAFNIGATRFPPINQDHGHPGPGAYEFDAIRDRKVKYHGSFGGPQTLITSVTIKCNEFGVARYL